jgi:hypothetical protein
MNPLPISSIAGRGKASGALLLVMTALASFSCATSFGDRSSYVFFGEMDPESDVWQEKVEAWQNQSRIDRTASPGHLLLESDAPLPEGKEIPLSMKIAEFASDEQRVILNDLSFLGETEQDAIKALERQLVDTVSDLLLKLDKEGKIVRRTKKIYSMMLFGILNFSHTWYDPKGGVDPSEFADMVVDLFLYGFTMPVPAKDAARPLRQRA